jgi:hypothetical protein
MATRREVNAARLPHKQNRDLVQSYAPTEKLEDIVLKADFPARTFQVYLRGTECLGTVVLYQYPTH